MNKDLLTNNGNSLYSLYSGLISGKLNDNYVLEELKEIRSLVKNINKDIHLIETQLLNQ